MNSFTMLKSDDLLNGNCKEVKWNEWKDAFLHISNPHAPTKTARLKVRSNTWITRDIVKMMYDRDRIHELAVKRKDLVLMEKYRKMRNTITDIIINRKWEYFSESAIHCVLVRVLFGLNSIPWYLRLIWNQFPMIWERRILILILKVLLTLLLPHSLTIILCDGRVRKVYIHLNLMKFDRKLIKIAGQHIVDSLLYITNDSLLNGT